MNDFSTREQAPLSRREQLTDAVVKMKEVIFNGGSEFQDDDLFIVSSMSDKEIRELAYTESFKRTFNEAVDAFALGGKFHSGNIQLEEEICIFLMDLRTKASDLVGPRTLVDVN